MSEWMTRLPPQPERYTRYSLKQTQQGWRVDEVTVSIRWESDASIRDIRRELDALDHIVDQESRAAVARRAADQTTEAPHE